MPRIELGQCAVNVRVGFGLLGLEIVRAVVASMPPYRWLSS